MAKARPYKLYLRDKVAACSAYPDDAFVWMGECETAKDIEELRNSNGMDTLDAKLGAAISAVAKGDLAREINTYKEKAAKRGWMMKGRQMWFLQIQIWKIDFLFQQLQT